METLYKIIETDEELEELITYCLETGMVSIDFETNARPFWDPEFVPTIMGVSFQPGSGWIIPLAHKESVFLHKWKKVLKRFSDLVVTNPAIVKIAWNLQFEYGLLHSFGHRMAGRIFDPMIGKYLLDEQRPNDLKSMVGRLLPEFAGYELPNTPSSKAKFETKVNFWANVPLEELAEYCAMDCDTTFRIHLHIENRLMDLGLYRLFRNLYMPLIRILSVNKQRGVPIDRSWLEHLEEKYSKLISENELALRRIPEVIDFQEEQTEMRVLAYTEALEDEIDSDTLTERQIELREEKISRVLAGEPSTKKEVEIFEILNFNSPKQLIDLLYTAEEGFGFPILEYTKPKKGSNSSPKPSTGESALLKLKSQDDSGFVSKLLELRGLTKLKSTYITNMLTDHLDQEDFIHPSYLPHATVTGRFGSRDPNFQNIPRVTTNPDIKKYIKPEKDFYVMEIDGSQMELRIVAEIANDPDMIDNFTNGLNIHATTAAGLTGEPYELINKARKDEFHEEHDWAIKEHKKAKVVNFGILYGMTKYKLAEDLTEKTGHSHTQEEAQDMIDKWLEKYPAVQKFIKKTHKQAIRDGYVTSPIGRKRRLPILLNKENKRYKAGEWNEALRQSVNSPVQGFASDVTQWTNIIIYEEYLRGGFPDYMFLMSTVHDSLEYPVHKEDVHWVYEKSTKLAASLKGMKKYLGYELSKVKMKFSGEFGITWGHAKEYNANTDYVEAYHDDVENFNKIRLEAGLTKFNDE